MRVLLVAPPTPLTRIVGPLLARHGCELANLRLGRRPIRSAEGARPASLTRHRTDSLDAVVWLNPARTRRAQARVFVNFFSDVPRHVRWIQTSPAALYDDAGSRWIDERWRQAPVASTIDAVEMERAVIARGQLHGTGVVLRMARPYHRDDPWTRRMLATARNGWTPFNGPADAYVPMIAAEDAACAIIHALAVPAGVYNVCDQAPATNAELNHLVAQLTARRTLYPLDPWLRGDARTLTARSHRLDATAFATATHWRPTVAPTVWTGLPRVAHAPRIEAIT
ncbi:MAG TPA: hypothetical protein VFH80_04385 [Solirubrobacteraceae bacterium]|nr:hypothetical protein [Solirubrobacteraceae bacterium]